MLNSNPDLKTTGQPQIDPEILENKKITQEQIKIICDRQSLTIDIVLDFLDSKGKIKDYSFLERIATYA